MPTSSIINDIVISGEAADTFMSFYDNENLQTKPLTDEVTSSTVAEMERDGHELFQKMFVETTDLKNLR